MADKISPAASRLTALLQRGSGETDASDVGIVVSHPDDETIGCGAHLGRWRGATLIMVTDGAPANLADARAQGFSTAADYAAARRAELTQALEITGFGHPDQLLALDIPDQQVPRRLGEVTRRLVDLIEARGLRMIITQAFEGGHPDHDATAFCVHAASRLLKARGKAVTIVEMPFYRADALGNMIRQQFVPLPGAEGHVARLSPADTALKMRMQAAHKTQQHILAPFAVDVERFRPAPDYDFTVLPNEGRLLYERYDWGLTGREWLELVRTAHADLGLE